MRAESLLLTAPRRFDWTIADLPDPGPNQLLLETIAGAISIGTELPQYDGTSRGHTPSYPAMTGYECIARVLAHGSRVVGLHPGDRVVSFYGHRTHAGSSSKRGIRKRS